MATRKVERHMVALCQVAPPGGGVEQLRRGLRAFPTGWERRRDRRSTAASTCLSRNLGTEARRYGKRLNAAACVWRRRQSFGLCLCANPGCALKVVGTV